MQKVAQVPGAGGYGMGVGDEKEPFYMRMTPMELDIQLQAAEIIFRSVLEGKRVNLSPHENIKDWEEEVLGDEWCVANETQRKEILSQVKTDGENTPAWVESLGHMGDIAWEVFEAGDNGERMRDLESMDRAEVIEQLKDLKFKVERSHYAKCGAGDRMFGFRACIALLRSCIRDSELLELVAAVLIECMKDHEYNRDGITCITVPAPPLERAKDFKDRGWSFLRCALDAFVVQAGGQGYSVMQGEHPKSTEKSIDSCSKDVAVLIAECIVRTKNAPAVLAQLKLVHEEPPADAWIERQELRALIPLVKQTCEDLNNDMFSGSSEWLLQLRDMIAEGEAFMATYVRAPPQYVEVPSTDAIVLATQRDESDASDAGAAFSDKSDDA